MELERNLGALGKAPLHWRHESGLEDYERLVDGDALFSVSMAP